MYSAFPELKDEKQIKELGELQTKAQLDALKRFIQTMEVDALTQKRIAQETRFLNQQLDRKNKQELVERNKKSKEVASVVKD